VQTVESLGLVFWLGLLLLIVAFLEGAALIRGAQMVRRANRELEVAATTDPLTGLMNRKAFFGEAAALIASGRTFALAMVDIDHFKSVNDRFGHPGGDDALRMVAAALKRSVRSEDVVARIGGEEFAILLDGLALDDAQSLCEQLRANVARVPVELPAGVALLLTLSVGLATRLPGERIDSLMARADRALYLAKSEGRNRVRLAA
jgi:diguanylate cyclase (GGDEF)-like protein